MMPVDGEKESSALTAVTPKPDQTRRSPAPPFGGAAWSSATVMVVTAESGVPAAAVQAMATDQQHDESVGVQDPSALRAAPVEAVGRRRRKKAMPEARAEFRAAADDDGAAQRLPCECEDKGATAGPSSPVKKKKKMMMKKKKAVRHLCGVRPTANGRYGAQIGHSKTMRWLGTFDNIEDAARAYDAAAVELHGARAVTNFKAGGGGGVPESSGLARADAPAEVQGVHGQLGGECSAQTWDSNDFDLLDDFPVLPALDFSYSLIPGPLLNDLRPNLPPAERQLVDEFIKEIHFTNW